MAYWALQQAGPFRSVDVHESTWLQKAIDEASSRIYVGISTTGTWVDTDTVADSNSVIGEEVQFHPTLTNTSLAGSIGIVRGVSRASFNTSPGGIISEPATRACGHTFFVVVDRVVSKVAERTLSNTGHCGCILVSLVGAGAVDEASSGGLISIITS